MKVVFIKLIFLFIALLPLSAEAQKTLRGIVRDQSGPMVGVTVCIVNAEGRVVTGTASNMNGEYVIRVPQLSDLRVEVSFIGYKTQKVTYRNQTVLNFTLEENITALDEVLITAKAIDKNNMGVDNRDLGVARQKIDLDEYQDMPITSVEDMLQGKLANVDIVAMSGDPGSRSSIRIRGTSSLNASNEPLIVIDEIPYETEINEDFDFATATDEDFGALVNIAPSDIASIEVLKDAAATALWGSKAANGVLLITTKKGTAGKPRFSITQKFNFKKEPKGIPMLNSEQYVSLMQEEMWNNVRDQEFSRGTMDLLTRYADISYDPTFQYFDEFNQNTDWMDLITQNAFTSETNFSMSGGGDRATYRFSAGYLKEGGTTIGTGLERITTRLNVDYRLSQRLRISASFSYSQSDKDANYSSNVRSHARVKMPNMSPYVIDSDGNMTKEYFTTPVNDSEHSYIQGKWSGDGTVYNPLAMAKESKNNTMGRTMRVSFNLQYNILKDLLFREDIAFDLGSTKNKKFLPSSATGVSWTHSDYNKGVDNMSDNITVTSNSKLIYTKSFQEKHKIVATAMLNIRDYSYNTQGSAVSGLGASSISDPTSGGKITSISSGSSQNRSVGLLGQIHYNYAERYMVTAGVRYDGNSRLGRNYRWGTFPSLQAVWRISNESFLVNEEWLDELKVRGSWGMSGNSPSKNYTYFGQFSSNGSFMDMDAIKPTSMQLNNLKWETTTQYNAGLDMTFFNDKVSVVLEYYKKVTDDLLQTDVPVQSTSGFSSVAYFNSGKMENRGWEIMIDLRNIVKIGDFSFSVTNLNLSRNRNRVLELPSNLTFDNADENENKNGQYIQRVVPGNPIGSFYGYKYQGVYQNYNETLARDANGNVIQNIYGEDVIMSINSYTLRAGDAKYEDVNHDGILDRYDVVYLGNSMPILTGGASLNFTYKGLRLRTSFQTRIGQSVINEARMNSESMYNGNNQSTSVLKRWRHEGDQTDIPRALWGRGYNYVGSDRFVEKASFLRLKDVMLSYTLPKQLVKKWRLQNVSCYITAYDVFTWTNYKGQDPEVGISSSKGIFQLAKDQSYTPRPFRLALGLTIDF